MLKVIISTGDSFGRWTVIGVDKTRRVLCKCSCGQERVIDKSNLTSGRSGGCKKCAKYPSPEPVEVRFWRNVIKTDGCWIWTRAPSRGYGRMPIKGKGNSGAHRISWELHNGPIPEGMDVLHSCDNPPCVNPSHLFLGTHQDNMKDCKRKGRFCRGERKYNAKLNKESVLAIRSEYAGKYMSERALAKKYGISRRNLEHVVKRLTWSHV